MKKIIIVIIGFFFLNFSFGQEIEMKLIFFGYKFIQNGQKLNWKALDNATESNLEANLLIKKAKTHKTISNILSFAGGALIGIPIGQSISDQDPNWTLAYIGGGIIGIGIPFSLSAFNKANEGVDKYNLSLKSATAFEFKPEFKVMANGNGIRLSMVF
ncbi:hypothetical protein [Formosa sp. A9]|uniref:hypothetical protein n=1 Tax=Formosa sp. A9 TaxID=3442641 RepID=UPI003EBA63C9